jgi:hypothetical protein
VPPPSHLTSCTLTKSNVYWDFFRHCPERTCSIHKFQVPNLIFNLFHLGRLSTQSVQVRGFLQIFVTSLFFYDELLSPRPTPKLEDHLLFDCPRMLIQYIRRLARIKRMMFTVENSFKLVLYYTECTERYLAICLCTFCYAESQHPRYRRRHKTKSCM